MPMKEETARKKWIADGRPAGGVFSRRYSIPRTTAYRWIREWKDDEAIEEAQRKQEAAELDLEALDGMTAQEQLAKFRSDAIPMLQSLITDPGTPPTVRLGAMREVFDRSGLVPPRRGTPLPADDAERERQALRDGVLQSVRSMSKERLLAISLLRDPQTPEDRCVEALAVLKVDS